MINGRKTGEINWDKRFFFTKRRYPSHYFRLFGGYGLSRQTLDYLFRNDIQRIQVQEERMVDGQTRRRIIWFNLLDWLRDGRKYVDRVGRHPGDYRVDEQLVCPLSSSVKALGGSLWQFRISGGKKVIGGCVIALTPTACMSGWIEAVRCRGCVRGVTVAAGIRFDDG